jgi:hypothetical protein
MSPKAPRPVWWDRAAAGNRKCQQHCQITPADQKPQYPEHLRQQREVERVCKIPRLVAELLAEIGRVHGVEGDIAAGLERFAAIDHDLLAALGVDRFPVSPIRVVGGRP